MNWKDFLGSKQNGFFVGDIQFSNPPTNDEEVTDLAVKVANELPKKIPSEQDIYWFVIEQYDKMQAYNGRAASMTSNFPISLLEIEYEGRRSEKSYVGKSNPGIVYLDTKVTPPLEAQFGKETAELIRVAIFGTFCSGSVKIIQKLRLKYAVHYHNNCISTGSFRFADEWNEVISSLDGE